jgi:hypothetical protein
MDVRIRALLCVIAAAVLSTSAVHGEASPRRPADESAVPGALRRREHRRDLRDVLGVQAGVSLLLHVLHQRTGLLHLRRMTRARGAPSPLSVEAAMSLLQVA